MYKLFFNSLKVQLFLVFLIICTVYINYKLVPLVAIPFLLVSYFRLFKYKNLSDVVILALMARCIMGFMMPNNNFSYNVFNAVCNYFPIFLYFALNPQNIIQPNFELIKKYKWTIFYTFCLLVLCTYNLEYAITEFPKEILPMLLFVFLICFSKLDLNVTHLLYFLRIAFIASILTYLIPNYFTTADLLLKKSIIFKNEVTLPMKISNVYVKQLGFIFDWRIMGQLAVLYLLIITINFRHKKNTLDHFLILVILITTFSRGPLVVGAFVYFGLFINRVFIKHVYASLSVLAISIFIFIIVGATYIANNRSKVADYVATFSLSNRNNAFQQREGFSSYALNKSSNDRIIGMGIGALSSKNAPNKLNFGFSDKEKKHPLYYYGVGDAYWALSVGEKGILVLILLILSLKEIFYKYNNAIFLFLCIGLAINLFGTDIPKEAMYYFSILVIITNIKYPIESDSFITKSIAEKNLRTD